MTIQKAGLVFLFSILFCSCAQKSSVPEEAANQVEASDLTPEEEVSEEAPADQVLSNDQEEEDEEKQGRPVVPVISKPLSKDVAQIKEQVDEVERESLGDPTKKVLGLYSELKACRMKLASKAYGGSGALFWDEPGGKLSEQWLSNSNADLKEHQATLLIVRYRRDYLKNELKACETELSSKKPAQGESTAVTVTEGDSDNDERVHAYVCRFVKKGASLRDFLIQTFSRGILQLENFDLDQEFLVANLKDEKGISKPHGLMFMGWRLSFDRGPLKLSEIIFDQKEAKLQYWALQNPSLVKDKDLCLKKTTGWN